MLKTCLFILTLLGLGSLLGGLGLLYFLGAEDSAEPPPSEPTPIMLEVGTTVFDSYTQDETITWAFAGQSGECITLDLMSQTEGFDPQLRLLNADKTLLAEDDDSGEWINARIAEFILPQDGTYLIEVSGYFVIANLTTAEYELYFQAC